MIAGKPMTNKWITCWVDSTQEQNFVLGCQTNNMHEILWPNCGLVATGPWSERPVGIPVDNK